MNDQLKTGWFWEIAVIKEVLETENRPRPKYIITNNRDEFIIALERIALSAFKATKDNLRYLEQLDKIKEVRAGADIEKVFPWIKDENYV